MNNRPLYSASEKKQFKLQCQELLERARSRKASSRKALIRAFGSIEAWEKKCADFGLNLIISQNTSRRFIFSLTDPQEPGFSIGTAAVSGKNIKFIIEDGQTAPRKRKRSKTVEEEWSVDDSEQMAVSKKRKTDNSLDNPLNRRQQTPQKKWEFTMEDGMQSDVESDSGDDLVDVPEKKWAFVLEDGLHSDVESDSEDNELAVSEEQQKNDDSATISRRVVDSSAIEQEKQVFMRAALKNAQLSDNTLKIVYVTPSGKIIIPDVNSCESQWAEYQAEFTQPVPQKKWEFVMEKGVQSIDLTGDDNQFREMSSSSIYLHHANNSSTTTSTTTTTTVTATVVSETAVVTATHPAVEEQPRAQEVYHQNNESNTTPPNELGEQQDTEPFDFNITMQDIINDFGSDHEDFVGVIFCTENNTSSVPAVQPDANVSGNASTLFFNAQHADQQPKDNNNKYSADDDWFSPPSPSPFD